MVTPTNPAASTTEPLAAAGPSIRDWHAGDAAACAAIYAPSVSGSTISFELEAPDAAEIARRFGALQDAGFPVLVAECDAVVGGYAYAGPFRARPAYRHTVEHAVYVADAARRGGVGRTLMQRLVLECGARGYRQMVAVIGDPQRSASVAFHRALGFAEAGMLRAVGHKFGRDLDIALMQLPLGD